jgi:cytochrome P450
MIDATFSPTPVTADHGQFADPFRDGVLHMGEPALVDDRTAAYRIIRSAGSIAHDAHGAYLVSDAEVAVRVLRHPELFSSKRLPTEVFPPGGGEAGRD